MLGCPKFMYTVDWSAGSVRWSYILHLLVTAEESITIEEFCEIKAERIKILSLAKPFHLGNKLMAKTVPYSPPSFPLSLLSAVHSSFFLPFLCLLMQFSIKMSGFIKFMLESNNVLLNFTCIYPHVSWELCIISKRRWEIPCLFPTDQH